MTRARACLPFASTSFALLLIACPSEQVPSGDGETSSDEGTTGDGDGDGDGTTGDGDGDGTTGDGDGDAAVCGDGVLDIGEACDDGNSDDGDGCSATCSIGPCGLNWTYTEAIPDSTGGGFDTLVGDDGSIYAAGVKINDDDDAWVAKWNADGTQAWSQSFDSGNGNDAAVAIALGPDGQVYVSGWMEGAGDDLWYAALDSSGEQLWAQVIQGMVADGDDLATGIALTPDGDLVIVGRTRVGEGNDDVWIRKASATDGAEIWTETWTGEGDGTFSTDRGGPVAVAADGSIWATAREHVDFDTQEATLLHLAGDGTFTALYQPQAGGEQQHDPIDVAVDGDAVYFAFGKGGFPYRGWLYKFGFDGSEQWVKTEADWLTIGEDWAVAGIDVDAEGNLGVAGVFTNEEAGEGITWGEAWVAKLDGAGEFVCRSSHMVNEGDPIVPPSLSIDSAGFSSAGFGLTGVLTASQGNATELWVGSFRP